MPAYCSNFDCNAEGLINATVAPTTLSNTSAPIAHSKLEPFALDKNTQRNTFLNMQ